MSRGLGKWQRLLYDAVLNDAKPNLMGRRSIYVGSWLDKQLGREATPAEITAVYRAARTLRDRGLVVTPLGWANELTLPE